MHAILEEVQAVAATMTVEDRSELIHYLEAVTPEHFSTREEEREWKTEIRSRFEDLGSGKDPGVPLDRVFGKTAYG